MISGERQGEAISPKEAAHETLAEYHRALLVAVNRAASSGISRVPGLGIAIISAEQALSSLEQGVLAAHDTALMESNAALLEFLEQYEASHDPRILEEMGFSLSRAVLCFGEGGYTGHLSPEEIDRCRLQQAREAYERAFRPLDQQG